MAHDLRFAQFLPAIEFQRGEISTSPGRSFPQPLGGVASSERIEISFGADGNWHACEKSITFSPSFRLSCSLFTCHAHAAPEALRFEIITFGGSEHNERLARRNDLEAERQRCGVNAAATRAHRISRLFFDFSRRFKFPRRRQPLW